MGRSKNSKKEDCGRKNREGGLPVSAAAEEEVLESSPSAGRLRDVIDCIVAVFQRWATAATKLKDSHHIIAEHARDVDVIAMRTYVLAVAGTLYISKASLPIMEVKSKNTSEHVFLVKNVSKRVMHTS